MRHFSILLAMVVLVVGSCRKAEPPQPASSPQPQITVSTQSQSFVTLGMTMAAQADPGQTLTKYFDFKTTASWNATVEDTKSSSWLSVSPSSGQAGAVQMAVSAQNNEKEESRKAVVTVNCGSVYVKFTVTQAAKERINVSSLTLSRTELTMMEGDSETLIAAVGPDNATDKTVTWSTSDANIATVDGNGKVNAVKAGTSTITAKAGDKTATCLVTVEKLVIPVSSVSLNKTSLTLTEGESETLTATVDPDNATDKKVSWSSSNTKIATVDSNGKVTAVKAGTVTITAKAGDKTATCSVMVEKLVIPVSSISLNKTSLTLIEGESETLTATVDPDNATDKKVSWSSSNTKIATVDSDGKVIAVKAGTVTITAKAGDKMATCTVTVEKLVIPVSSISLNKTSLTLTEGENETLTATVGPDNATDKTVTWSTSDASVATVDQSGRVTAVKAGSVTITAKAGDKTATCAVTVEKLVIPVSSVSLNKTSLTLTEGESETLTATVSPDNAADKTVIWATSDANIAIVSQNGKITAVKAGTAVIMAKAGDRVADCSVTVEKLVIPVSSISLNKTSLTLTEGDSETLTATVGPDNATDKTVTWSTSDASVSTVDQSGRVTAVKAGTATITAKAGDKTATCSVTIEEPAIPVSSISVNKTSLTLTEGVSETLTATVSPDNATDKIVIWSSSDANVATVDANGKVTAVKAGNVTITAKAGDKSATCDVLVNPYVAVTSITLNKTNLTLLKGESETLVATVGPDNATDKTVTWSSFDDSIATVDQNGKVSGLKVDRVIITAKAGKKVVTCLVQVVEIETVSEVQSGGTEGVGEEQWIL